MVTTIRTYDGSFSFKMLSREKADHLDSLFHEAGIEADLALQSLDFSWMGQERDESIIKLFRAVAAAVIDAEGELRCEIDDDNVDPRFEFFTIKQGRLWLRRGSLVREVEETPLA